MVQATRIVSFSALLAFVSGFHQAPPSCPRGNNAWSRRLAGATVKSAGRISTPPILRAAPRSKENEDAVADWTMVHNFAKMDAGVAAEALANELEELAQECVGHVEDDRCELFRSAGETPDISVNIDAGAVEESSASKSSHSAEELRRELQQLATQCTEDPALESCKVFEVDEEGPDLSLSS